MNASETPDLLADNDSLREIIQPRDAVRSPRKEAKAIDAEADSPSRACDADVCRCCLPISGRTIGGQQRDFTEMDRACLAQVLGLPIQFEELTKIGAELRSRSAAELDAMFPDVLRRKITSDNSIFDRCDSIIRNFETIASSTAEVYGDKKGKRANMAKRIGLQLHWLVDQERERAANSPEVPAASGTGKTTVARLLARAYRALGVLSKGHLVKVDRSGLVAGCVGHTGLKTKEVVKRALDGALFIDEACALLGEGKDYGPEAINTLLKPMEDHRGRIIVIVAGYTDRMTAFLESNPGLKSRFNKFIHFDDYTAAELGRIFKYTLDNAQYRPTEEALLEIEPTMQSLCQMAGAHFGNARAMRRFSC